jgi:hypothetical protein
MARELVAEVEELGYGAIWYPEAVWKESLAVGSLLLASTTGGCCQKSRRSTISKTLSGRARSSARAT